MITTHKKHHGKSIPKATKLAIALKSIKGKHTISAISKEHNVSRTTVYLQQEKALKAANPALGSNGTANRLKAFRLFLMVLTHHVLPHLAWQRNIVQAY
jgi:transposase-like protein